MRSNHRSTTSLAAAALAIAVLGFGGCAQSPQQLATNHHGKEYFPSSVYGAASRRVIADGQPIPHGGGQYLVGKPYTIAGQTYYPSERKITQVGLASWYGDAFHGRLTANGEIYDRDGFTAAHPTMPLPSYARVTNLRNNYSMIVRVNDRGPYHANRIMDVSRKVAEALDFQRGGTSTVKVEYVGRASLAGSDDSRLYATLRTNGPARTQGLEQPTMVAEAAPRPARVASLEPHAPQPLHRQPAPRPEPVAEEDQPSEDREIDHPHRPALVRSVVREEDVERTPMPTGTLRHVSRHGDEDRVAMHDRDRHVVSVRNEEKRGRSVQVASLGGAAEARTFADREMKPIPRPGRAGAATHAVSRIAAHPGSPAPRDVALPPARPIHLAAASAAAGHHGTALRLTRSRDD